MGNAAEVSINRWGINLFWMQTWFVGNSFQLFLQKSLFIEQFIRTFLLFGMRHSYRQTTESTWYNSKGRLQQLQSKRYFRFIEICDDLSVSKTYRLRNRLQKIYFSKIWFLKYQNWIVIATHFFHVKPKSSLLIWQQSSSITAGDTTSIIHRKKSIEIRRSNVRCVLMSTSFASCVNRNYHF